MKSTENEVTKIHEYTPTMKQRFFVQALLSQDVKGNKTEAMRVSGVDKGVFYDAMKKHEFREWFQKQCEQLFSLNEGMVSFSLLAKCNKGDVLAIRTYYELKGRIGKSMTVNNTNVNSVRVETNDGERRFLNERDQRIADEMDEWLRKNSNGHKS